MHSIHIGCLLGPFVQDSGRTRLSGQVHDKVCAHAQYCEAFPEAWPLPLGTSLGDATGNYVDYEVPGAGEGATRQSAALLSIIIPPTIICK